MALVEPHAVPLPSSRHTSMDDFSDHSDSMIPVRLSQTPEESSLDLADEADSASVESDTTIEPETHTLKRSSFDIMHGLDMEHDEVVWEEEEATADEPDEDYMNSNMVRFSVRPKSWRQSEQTLDEFPDLEQYQSSRSSSRGSADSTPVDWSELDTKEEREQKEGGADESTNFLLARLEQENNAIATDPRSAVQKTRQSRQRKGTRPPSIQVLKNLVQNPSEVTKRYSLLPNPPPMTELEFWAALVKDYSQTAQRLPALTTSKIRGGVPPPLRGVVWMSVVGARDQELSDDFDRLSMETSPYENMIGKDIGRSFPGVEMFKEAGGEGQSALAKVLKCFSLYDKEIGYCQGLGFLVGPLLMQMCDKDAFCVLVRLMENYDLRSCFMPDLAGLHLRIYQFQQLLNQHMPKLAAHLASLQVEAAYLSQWFLSFFAVTCPLSMLFRIYDVILAEGASETIMRVALSLMRRNEAKLMLQTEFEEVMQMLLSRQLWEPYSFNADDLVNDFVSLTGMVTRESLQKLEATFKEAPESETVAKSTFFPSVAATASSFVGRLWTSNSQPKHAHQNSTLSPTTPGHEKRPSTFLRRSASKQSIASTMNSTDVSSEGNGSVGTVTTDATAVSRDSAGEMLSAHSKTGSMAVPLLTASKEDKGLHGQIEDLLTAISEMQREQTLLTSQLQKEREERDEDYRVFEDLIKCVRVDGATATGSSKADRRQTTPSPLSPSASTGSLSTELNEIVERVDQRLAAHRDLRRSSMLETKQRLRESLVRSKDQLGVEMTRSLELTRQLDQQEKESASLREQLRDARARVQEGFQEKQKLERTVQDFKSSRRESLAWTDLERPSILRTETAETNRTSIALSSGSSSPALPGGGGLRELKLNRSSGGSNLAPPSALPSRTSSLATQKILATKDHAPASEEQMLVELVNAKTAEACARQELEEVKARMDALRKMLALPSPTQLSLPTTPASAAGGHKPSASEATVTSSTVTKTGIPSAGSEISLTPPAAALGGSFWSWGRKASGPAKTVSNNSNNTTTTTSTATSEKS